MSTEEENANELRMAALRVSEQFDADVIIYLGPVAGPHDSELIETCRQDGKRPNAYLVLLTYGGNPHVAYRIGRCLHRNYEKVTACAPGACASAGTLLVLAANELVMSDLGLLGPLDIQLQKADELFEMTSGLTVQEAIVTLRSEAKAMFTSTLIDLKAGSGGQITLKTALDTAAKLTGDLFGPLFAQIDPMRLGEDGRSTRIIEEYGNRLAEKGENLKPGALQKLVAGYPSHLFDIDREEAQELFINVRSPDETERRLVDILCKEFREPPSMTAVTKISAQPSIASEEKPSETTNGSANPQRAGSEAGPPRRGQARRGVPKITKPEDDTDSKKAPN